MAEQVDKTDKMLAYIFEFLAGKLPADSLMKLKDGLMADHGVSHELVAPRSYWGKEANAGASDAAHNPVTALRDWQEAQNLCIPLVGKIACDTATATYRTTLARLGLRSTGSMSFRELRETCRILAEQRSTRPKMVAADMALDAAERHAITAKIPGLARFLEA